MPSTSFTTGLHEVADGCFAYLQPDGSWGWSNAGLISGDGVSLLVDTLYDLKLTQAMLDAMAVHTAAAPIGTLVNTHANGDHCYGNSLVHGAEIVASVACAEEMPEVPPSMMSALRNAPGETGELFRQFFGAFEFDGIELALPTRTFEGRLDLTVGGKPIELIQVGPAHTKGDVLVHSPQDGVVYTGDILFIGGTPISWAGPLSNWVKACDLILDMGAATVVPGHGPVTDAAGVREVRDYLVFVEAEATKRHAAGMSAWDAAQDIALEHFGRWGEFGRIAVNVETVYRTLDPTHQSANVIELFKRMAVLEGAGH